MPSDYLKRIEEKHKPLVLMGQPGPICDECDMGRPCDVVKLARALADCIDVLQRHRDYDGALIRSKRTLAEVAGVSDGE